ncbi:GNAT family N-acetyltransferase [Alkaliphilus pronyensis]|uniref:GNAT family N-acetyltransferase n=1 Tax=Alkaliphilus pronyensis TaxID=1482732 RepID=A0A6I0EW65_9FIRM|nr:GNAT family N-acetyltransferase [Alkaliphilus pronyensis]KAB3531055.1 GNAT family N-acetyltransferase [Alkaliphilus pronyensis]
MIVLKGKKVTLKTFTRGEHHQFWQKYVADPGMDPEPYIYDKEHVDNRYDIITEKESWYPRVGVFLQDGTPIGELSFKRINYEKSQCELGIVLANDDYKGLGYGTEAFELAIDYIFNTLKLKNILADTMGSNVKMQKILKKFGFGLFNREGQYYDMGNRKEDKLNYKLSI